MSKLGDNIRALREHFGMTIKELSIKSKVGQSTISEIETGKATNPKSDTLAKIADSFNIQIDLLFQDNPIELITNDKTSSILKEDYATYEAQSIKTTDKSKSFTDNLNKLDNEEAKLSYISAIMDFEEPEKVVKFILEQPMFMAYGGYDLKSMSNEEILEIAQDMLFAMKLSLEKRKKKNR